MAAKPHQACRPRSTSPLFGRPHSKRHSPAASKPGPAGRRAAHLRSEAGRDHAQEPRVRPAPTGPQVAWGLVRATSGATIHLQVRSDATPADAEFDRDTPASGTVREPVAASAWPRPCPGRVPPTTWPISAMTIRSSPSPGCSRHRYQGRGLRVVAGSRSAVVAGQLRLVSGHRPPPPGRGMVGGWRGRCGWHGRPAGGRRGAGGRPAGGRRAGRGG